MRESALFQHYAGPATGDYYGWASAASFGAFEQEYLAATRGVACFDSSFRGRLRVTGRDALDLLHRLSTNDLRDLGPGEVAGTVLTTEKGRVVDFLTLAHNGGDLLLITSPTKETEVRSWIEKFVILEDVSIDDITGDTVMASLIGPEVESVHLTTGASPGESLVQTGWGEIRVIVTRRPLVRELHLMTEAVHAGEFWAWLQEKFLGGGASPAGSKIPLVGHHAYEAYRIAFGIPMALKELTQSHNPYDVGLRPFISYTKGCYIGQEVIARLDTYQKVRRRLSGLVVTGGEGPVRPGAVLTVGGEEVGWVTSATEQPVFGAQLGLAVIGGEIAIGAEVHCPALGGVARATVCELPIRWP